MGTGAPRWRPVSLQGVESVFGNWLRYEARDLRLGRNRRSRVCQGRSGAGPGRPGSRFALREERQFATVARPSSARWTSTSSASGKNGQRPGGYRFGDSGRSLLGQPGVARAVGGPPKPKMACPFALLVAVSDAHDRARTREPGDPTPRANRLLRQRPGRARSLPSVDGPRRAKRCRLRCPTPGGRPTWRESPPPLEPPRSYQRQRPRIRRRTARLEDGGGNPRALRRGLDVLPERHHGTGDLETRCQGHLRLVRALPHSLAHACVGIVDAGDLDPFQRLIQFRLQRLSILETQRFGAAWLVCSYRLHSLTPPSVARHWFRMLERPMYYRPFKHGVCPVHRAQGLAVVLLIERAKDWQESPLTWTSSALQTPSSHRRT